MSQEIQNFHRFVENIFIGKTIADHSKKSYPWPSQQIEELHPEDAAITTGYYLGRLRGDLLKKIETDMVEIFKNNPEVTEAKMQEAIQCLRT